MHLLLFGGAFSFLFSQLGWFGHMGTSSWRSRDKCFGRSDKMASRHPRDQNLQHGKCISPRTTRYLSKFWNIFCPYCKTYLAPECFRCPNKIARRQTWYQHTASLLSYAIPYYRQITKAQLFLPRQLNSITADLANNLHPSIKILF